MQTLRVNSLLEHPRQREIFNPLEGMAWTKFVDDISKRGILQALIVSDRGGLFTVCDGHQRLRAARELEWDEVPVSIQAFSSEVDEVECLVMNNVQRRQLSRDEIDRAIGYYLKLDTIKSNRVIAAKLGVDHKTVEEKRQALESGGEIPHLEKLEGKDGKLQARYKSPRAIPQPCQVEYMVVDNSTGQMISESEHARRFERVEVDLTATPGPIPFETRTVEVSGPTLQSRACKTLKSALYMLEELSESDLRYAMQSEPFARDMAENILEKLRSVLEVKSSGLKTITIGAKAVN